MNNLQQDELRNDINNNGNIIVNGRNENDPPINQEIVELRVNQQQNQKRMKWSKEMNTNIIRCYFHATLIVPDQPYRKEMTRKWKQIYPDSILTEQRICDQKRIS